MKSSRRVDHRLAGCLAAVVFFIAPAPRAAAQVKSNLSSSVTSESMTAVWVALLAGEIDAAIVGVANFHLKLDHRLNTRPEIKRAEDLRGKRIAISGPGSTSHMVSLLALQGLNLDPAQAHITFLTIPGTELNRRLALQNASVEATTIRGAVGDLYGGKGSPVLYNLKAAGVALPQNTLVTTRRLAAAKPQVIEGYLKALIEATAMIVDPAYKELVIRLLAVNLRLINFGDAEESYQAVINSFERMPTPSLDGMKRLQRLLAQVNPKVSEVPVETLVDGSFVGRLATSGFIQSVYKKR